MSPCGTIMAINWRTKLITELDMEGKVVKQFTSPELQQPMCIAINSKSDVIIADNTAECVFIFDNTGRWDIRDRHAINSAQLVIFYKDYICLIIFYDEIHK